MEVSEADEIQQVLENIESFLKDLIGSDNSYSSLGEPEPERLSEEYETELVSEPQKVSETPITKKVEKEVEVSDFQLIQDIHPLS